MHIRGLKGSTRLTGAGSKVISLCAHVGLAQSRDHTHRWAWAGKQSKGGRHRQGLAAGSVGGLQHRFTQRKVPVVFSPVLFEMLPSHVLCRALFELHISKAPVFGCTLGRRQNV